MKIQTQSKGSLEKYFTSEEIFIPRDLQMICKQNKAKWFAKQLASESLHGKHQRNKTTLSKHSLTKDRHKMCGRPKAF